MNAPTPTGPAPDPDPSTPGTEEHPTTPQTNHAPIPDDPDDIRDHGPGGVVPADVVSDGVPAAPGAGDAGGSSQASRLVALAVGEFNLVQGDDARPYAVERDGPSIALPLRGRDGLRQRLARRYYALTGVAAGGSALADAMTVIEGMAADAEPVPVWLRTARDPSGALVLDLGDRTGRAVVIVPGRWYLAQRSPVLFRRTTLTGQLPIPAPSAMSAATSGNVSDRPSGNVSGHLSATLSVPTSAPVSGDVSARLSAPVSGRVSGDVSGLARLRVLLNVDDAGFRLLVGWLIAAIVPDIPHPILALLGEHGTAKSSAARFVVGLIDPSPAPLRTPPRDVRSWAVMASASWTVVLDNISTVLQWFSDTLCKAVTGDGIVERTLHTDDDVTVLAFRRVIVLTSIDAGALAGDLTERLLPVELHPIPDDVRREDSEVAAAYAAAAPAALAEILELLAAVLAVLPDTRPDRLPRMADFARILAALDVVTGWTTLPDYLALTTDGQRQVAADDPLGSAVFALLDGQAVGWTGTPSELHDALTSTLPGLPPKDWPTARNLSGRLRRLAPALRDHGVSIEFERTKHARIVHLTRDPTTDNPGGPDHEPCLG